MRRVREGRLRRNPPASTMKLPDPIRIEISALDVDARAVKGLDGQVAVLVLVLRARAHLDAEVFLVFVWDFVAAGQHRANAGAASEAVVSRSRARVFALGFAFGKDVEDAPQAIAVKRLKPSGQWRRGRRHRSRVRSDGEKRLDRRRRRRPER